MRGFTIAPCVGYLFSKRGGVDLALGYSAVETKQSRTDANGNSATSEFDSDRWFVAGNLNGLYNWSN
jgi:hypothetical protein